MPAAEFLLIDNSNSFTKLILADRDRLTTRPRKIATRTLRTAQIRHALRGWHYQHIVLCSVVPAAAAKITATLAKTTPIHIVTHRSPLGVGINYPKPATIGADRLANAAAAFAHYGAPCVVVDFGTAVTFDILAAPGAYIGGVIAPGLEAMTDYLHQRTAKLPRITLLEPPGPIGKSTRHAMLAGAVFGYRGLVQEILTRIRAELATQHLPVIATGGYADLIAIGVPSIHHLHENLTLEGLRIIANAAFPNRKN